MLLLLSYCPHCRRHRTYRGRRQECKRKFTTKAALHTHIGWHKRKDNETNGVYDARDNLKKVSIQADLSVRCICPPAVTAHTRRHERADKDLCKGPGHRRGERD